MFIPMITIYQFLFRDDFVDLTDDQFRKALQIVNTEFSGIPTLWSILPPDVANAKRELCINYLIAWKLSSLYPDQALSSVGTGGIPLESKKVGPITIKYSDTLRQGNSILSMLTTNQYGIEALTMIQSAPEMFQVY